MNQSIYTESAPLLARKDLVEWLDGCGAVWGSGAVFSKSEALVYPYVCFGGPPVKYFQAGSSYHLFEGKYTHIPTGTEFCERVAEILGVEKPVFEQFGNSEQVDISKKETTTEPCGNSEQLDIEDVPALYHPDDHDKLFPGRNNTMGEGSLTQEDIEILLGDSIVKPIKGMAIEVSRLDEKERKYIESIRDHKWEWYNWRYCAITMDRTIYATDHPIDNDYEKITITESPTEFLKYVAQQTGKEYKKTAAYDVQKFVANREGMAERLAKAPFTNEELMDLPDEEIGKLNFGKPTYPHKTYRILDSLDGIPLDKRIPLSEWIPPVGQKVLVITENWFMDGFFERIESKIIFETAQGSKALTLDGHWMRIV